MDYLVNLNLNKNELQNAVIQPLAAAPSTGKLGQVYYNSADHTMYQYNGTAWIAVGKVRDVQTSSGTSIVNANGVAVLPAYPAAGTTATAVSTTASGGSATTWSKSDHVHSISLATGDSNGQVKIAGSNVSVKGLADAAYKGVVTSIVSSGSGANKTSTDLPTTNAITSYVDTTVGGYIPKSLLTSPGAIITSIVESGTGIVPKVVAGGLINTVLYNSAANTPAWGVQQPIAINGTTYMPIAATAPTIPTIYAPTTYGPEEGVLMGQQTEGHGVRWVSLATESEISSATSTSTARPTSAYSVKSFVETQIAGIPTPMQFKGTVGTGGTYTDSTLPAAATANEGWTVKVITAGTYRGVAAKVGDTLVSDGSAWILIPSGDEPSGTVTNIATGTGLTGGPITTSGTISLATVHTTAPGAKGDTTNQEPTYGATFKVPSLTVDAYGRVTAVGEHTVKIPAKPTVSAVTSKISSNQTPGWGATFNIEDVTQATSGQITTATHTVKIPNSTATQSAAGLMSAADKVTLDNLSAASQGALVSEILTIAEDEFSVDATGIASKLISWQAYQGGAAVMVDYNGSVFSVAEAATSDITIKCIKVV